MKKFTKFLAGFLATLILCCLVPFTVFATDTNTSADSLEGDILLVDMNEGKQIWEDYLAAFAPLAEDEETYEGLLRYVLKDDSAQRYAEVTGNSKEKYVQMTSLDKFLWTYTYINLVHYSNSTSIVNYSTWFNCPIGNSQKIIQANGGTQEMLEANNKFLEWSYSYYVATGKVYNFLEGFEDIEDVSGSEDESVPVSEETTVSETESSVSAESESSVSAESESNEIQDTQDTSSDEQEEGIWDGVITYLKDHIFTIVILLILVIATISIVIYRRNKAIDDK